MPTNIREILESASRIEDLKEEIARIQDGLEGKVIVAPSKASSFKRRPSKSPAVSVSSSSVTASDVSSEVAGEDLKDLQIELEQETSELMQIIGSQPILGSVTDQNIRDLFAALTSYSRKDIASPNREIYASLMKFRAPIIEQRYEHVKKLGVAIPIELSVFANEILTTIDKFAINTPEGLSQEELAVRRNYLLALKELATDIILGAADSSEDFEEELKRKFNRFMVHNNILLNRVFFAVRAKDVVAEKLIETTHDYLESDLKRLFWSEPELMFEYIIQMRRAMLEYTRYNNDRSDITGMCKYMFFGLLKLPAVEQLQNIVTLTQTYLMAITDIMQKPVSFEEALDKVNKQIIMEAIKSIDADEETREALTTKVNNIFDKVLDGDEISKVEAMALLQELQILRLTKEQYKDIKNFIAGHNNILVAEVYDQLGLYMRQNNIVPSPRNEYAQLLLNLVYPSELMQLMQRDELHDFRVKKAQIKPQKYRNALHEVFLAREQYIAIETKILTLPQRYRNDPQIFQLALRISMSDPTTADNKRLKSDFEFLILKLQNMRQQQMQASSPNLKSIEYDIGICRTALGFLEAKSKYKIAEKILVSQYERQHPPRQPGRP